MIKERFAKNVDAFILRHVPAVTRIPLSPDQLTLLGVGISLVAGIAFALGWVRTGGLLMILSGIPDLIDGIIARHRGTASTAGAFFDSTMDRVSDLLIFSGIAVGMAAARDPWGAALACWALSGSVVTSYARARAEVELGDLSVGIMERAERFIVLVAFSIFGFLALGLWIVAIFSTITCWQRITTAMSLLRSGDHSRPARLRLVESPDPVEATDV